MIQKSLHAACSCRLLPDTGILYCLLFAVSLCVACSSTARFSHAPAQADKSTSAAPSKKASVISSQDRETVSSEERRKAGKTVDNSSTVAPSGGGRKHVSFRQTGMASYYARKFHGRRTASGERYNMRDLTAAHPRLPFGVRVRVTNISNNRSVVVRINDRGPHTKKRIIDLSLSAAEKIGLVRSGIARVTVETVE